MGTIDSILAELASKGSEKTRATYVRHGMPAERVFGVSVADLKLVAKTIKGQQALALELYSTGNMDAMYLAGMVADGKKMSRVELEAWAAGTAGMTMICEYTVPWVAVESPLARELAVKWIGSEKEDVAAAGWCTYGGLVATKADAELDLEEIRGLLRRVVAEVHGAQNRVRSTMNKFVIAVGSYLRPLFSEAMAAAGEIGKVSVDVGDTACTVPLATASIAKVEAAGKLGLKKKTIRC